MLMWEIEGEREPERLMHCHCHCHYGREVESDMLYVIIAASSMLCYAKATLG